MEPKKKLEEAVKRYSQMVETMKKKAEEVEKRKELRPR